MRLKSVEGNGKVIDYQSNGSAGLIQVRIDLIYDVQHSIIDTPVFPVCKLEGVNVATKF